MQFNLQLPYKNNSKKPSKEEQISKFNHKIQLKKIKAMKCGF